MGGERTYVDCERVFARNWRRILTDAKAKELKAYAGAHSGEQMNKMFSWYATPVVLLVSAGVHYKFPEKMLKQRQMFLGAWVSLFALMNVYGIQCYQKRVGMTADLVGKYVVPLNDKQFAQYGNLSHKFPQAR